MKKDVRVYLLHIRDALSKIIEYTSSGKEAFFKEVNPLAANNPTTFRKETES